MKLIAYISIFLIVHSNVIFAGKRAARVLLRSQPSKGRPKEYKIDDFKLPELIQISTGEPTLKTKSEMPLNTAVLPDTTSSGEANPKAPTGLAEQLQNLSSALPLPNNSPSSSQSKDGDLERKLPGSPNGGDSGGGSSEGQSFGRWYPVCVLIDPSIGDANKQITELVQMSAACQVNLVPFVRVVNGFNPNDEKSINESQRSTCNLKEGGVAEKGSTLVITNQSSTVADEMCGMDGKDENGKPKTEVAGCNQLGSGASGKSQEIARGKKSSGDGFGGIAEGSVAVGIVDAQGYRDGKVWSHEAIGHGQMAWPNGKDAGNGIGDPNNKDEASSEEGKEGAYTGKGCAQMQASAIPDPQHYRKFYANKTSYYSHESMSKNPMQLGEPIWKKFKDGPQNSDVAQKNPTAPPRGNDGGNSSSSATPLATAGPGHKKPMGQVSSGSKFRSGDTSNESERNPKRGDDSPDTAGSAITGNGEAPKGNNMIVANPYAKNSDGENPSADNAKAGFGDQSSDFFAGSSKSETNLNSSETQTASTLKGKKEDGGLNDSEFFKKTIGEKVDTRIGRTKPRTSDGTFVGTSKDGTSMNRTLSSSPSTPAKSQRKQVDFEGGV